MDLLPILERFGDAATASLAGAVVGLLFGAAAQQSRFCLRSATIEFWHGAIGPSVSVWLLVFFSAFAGTQALISLGLLDKASLRQLATAGSLSGAIIGGTLFGAGMILARGCASRLLVLSATGNLRALVTGVILTIVAQASLSGVLSPLRLSLSRIWMIEADARELTLSLPQGAWLATGLVALALSVIVALWNRVRPIPLIGALGVGGAIVAGWLVTNALAAQSFQPVTIQSVSFTGPSTDTLMALITAPSPELGFGFGLVPGVFAGSFLASVLTGEFRIQQFDDRARMPRYLVGATLMGFGSMLAGGCAVGAGVTGSSVLSLTAIVALACMWGGAAITDALLAVRANGTALARPGKS